MTTLPTEGRPAERFANDTTAWLTTVRPDGAPQSSPVWFVAYIGALYVRSQPGAAKLRNITAHPSVSFHLESDGAGGDIVTVEGIAEVLDAAPGGLLDAYVSKYEALIRDGMGTTPEQLANQYSATIRITPTRSRAW